MKISQINNILLQSSSDKEAHNSSLYWVIHDIVINADDQEQEISPQHQLALAKFIGSKKHKSPLKDSLKTLYDPNLIKCFKILKKRNLLTQESHECLAHLLYPKAAEYYAKVLSLIERSDLNKKKYLLKKILEVSSPGKIWAYAKGFRKLKRANILDYSLIIDMLKTNGNCYDLSKIILFLRQNNLFDKEEWKLILQNSENADEILRGIKYLYKKNLATPINRKIIINGVNGRDTAKCLIKLSGRGEEVIEKFIELETFSNIITGYLFALEHAQVIDDTNLLMLFQFIQNASENLIMNGMLFLAILHQSNLNNALFIMPVINSLKVIAHESVAGLWRSENEEDYPYLELRLTGEQLSEVLRIAETYQENNNIEPQDLITYLSDVWEREVQLQSAAINNAESTETKSVHVSAFQSAQRLFELYSDKMNGKEDEHLKHMRKWLRKECKPSANDTPLDNIKKRAAYTCFKRLMGKSFGNHSFNDPVDGDSKFVLTIKQLFILSWLAIHDDELRKGTLADAKSVFAAGFYEIQRGNNLSKDDVDDLREKDYFICPNGTFNKPMEKLDSIHPAVKIDYVTMKLASFKLPKVVLDELERLLTKLAQTETFADAREFSELYQSILEQGIDPVWEKLKENVANTMFEEFGSLFLSREDEKFIDFIDSGQFVEVPELSRIDEFFRNSKGYSTNSNFFNKSKQTTPPLAVNDEISSNTLEPPF